MSGRFVKTTSQSCRRDFSGTSLITVPRGAIHISPLTGDTAFSDQEGKTKYESVLATHAYF